MVSRSYSNLLDLAAGEPSSPSLDRMFPARRLPRVMTVPGIILDDTAGVFDSSDRRTSPASSSSHSSDRIIVVAHQLPIIATRGAGGWLFSWDEQSLLLQLKDGLGEDDAEVYYVGTLREDVPVSEQEEVAATLLESFHCVPAFLPVDLHSRFYHGFCKQQLWPLFHYMLPLSADLGGRFERRLWQAYVSANKIFADRILEIINPEDDFVWIHDYHLLILPTFLRKRFNRVKLGLFLHSPFPSSEIYKSLPVREELLRAMLNSDLIGFHTFDYARHFLSCCGRMLGLTYESKRGYIGVEYYGRTVGIKILPVGIHLQQLQSALELPETENKVAELVNQLKEGKQVMILGVDDMDIFKGITLKLLAMEQLLATHYEWRGKLVLVQIANPARGRGKDVEDVQLETKAIVERINETFGFPGYQPVVLIDQPLQFYERMAYYVVAECCLVTAVRDGMNLTPYEYVIARQGNEKLDSVMGWSSSTPRSSTLVVSEFVGCSPSLSGAVRVNPWNTEAVAEAMSNALQMIELEKQVRHDKHYRYVSTHHVGYWAHSFMQDLLRTCKDHSRRRCWGIGFGLGFRVVALDANFKKLGMEYIFSAFKRTKMRAILLDYDGIFLAQKEVDKYPDTKTIEILNNLCRDKNNLVFLVSSSSRMMLSEWFSPCESLAIAAEDGYFFRMTGDGEWETSVAPADCSFKQVVEPVMRLYEETTDGSTIDYNETSLIWSYKHADRDFGSCQAKELLTQLEKLFVNEPVCVKGGQHKVVVKPQGVNKGLIAKKLLSTMRDRDILPDFVLCIGDDGSDEDMFEVIASAASSSSLSPTADVFACTVGRKPSKAKYYLDDEGEVVRLMEGLAAISRHQSSCSSSSQSSQNLLLHL